MNDKCATKLLRSFHQLELDHHLVVWVHHCLHLNHFEVDLRHQDDIQDDDWIILVFYRLQQLQPAGLQAPIARTTTITTTTTIIIEELTLAGMWRILDDHKNTFCVLVQL